MVSSLPAAVIVEPIVAQTSTVKLPSIGSVSLIDQELANEVIEPSATVPLMEEVLLPYFKNTLLRSLEGSNVPLPAKPMAIVLRLTASVALPVKSNEASL